MPEMPIHTLGRVVEVRSPLLYLVALPNGKVILAHVSRDLAAAPPAFAIDETLLLEMTPYDFETARIVGTHPAEPKAEI